MVTKVQTDDKAGNLGIAVFGSASHNVMAIVAAMDSDPVIRKIVLKAAQQFALRKFFNKDEPCDCAACTAARNAHKN